MAKKSIRDIDVTGKRCLVRVDFNVPLDDKGDSMVITDDTRIKETLPTLKYLLEQGAKVILCSHLGRPKGQRDPKQSLKPVAARLGELLGLSVGFAEDSIGEEAQTKAQALGNGDVLLLENVRFYAGEEKNDPELAKQFAALAEIYVNDAFGSAHRAHSSTAGVAAYLPAVSGLLMEKELAYMHDELQAPERPFVVILGGAKVSDKIKVIDRLLDKADTILIGGGMAYTFKLALGESIGKSLCEPDQVDTAKAALAKAEEKGVKFLLPVDNYIVEELNFKDKTVGPGRYTTPGEGIPDGWEGVDIGPESVKLFSAEVASAKTVVWNGPMGVFEIKDCAKGTFAIAETIAENTSCKSIIGGGDSVKAVKKAGVADKVTFISTGGGASLELLEGKELPGVAALLEK
ncbi:phosphoglycerate kinase [Verrucomicrobium spinosum]|uniref:phosphoglycerate kinase n=1 Tax=Verrucomicrobium spinosum TaxID=2736 RepID=UPI0004927D59|nr:phosphoglycerate kinase [Verrucomicrobium spinosum]